MRDSKPFKTIKQPAVAIIFEKKSEFIAKIAPVSSESEALEIIAEIRANQRKASHNCYAYRIREGDTERYNDDGEPSGTAGMPILEILRGREVTDVVCVVTRYYGGIRLGASGLTRTYARAAKTSFCNDDVIEMSPAQQIRVTVDYSEYERTRKELVKAGGIIISEDFTDVTEIMAIMPLDSAIGEEFVEIVPKLHYNFGKKV